MTQTVTDAPADLAADTQFQTQDWQQLIKPYSRADWRRGVRQILNTFVPYVALWTAMVWSLDVSYWLTLALAIPTAGLTVRIFIFQHDCGHGSFFRSTRANDALGLVCGVLTLTPYYQWRHQHAIHHATSGDLSRRGVGDITTLTVKEYRALSPWGRLKYRMYRHPFVLFWIGPFLHFAIFQRFSDTTAGARARWSVWFTNLCILNLVLLGGATLGFDRFLAIQVPVSAIAAAIGVWMFYVQHQFESAYWTPAEEWDYHAAAIKGSSYYRLPAPLQWITGNIGFHHIHHLGPRIPNYLLQRCYDENEYFHQSPTIDFVASLRTAGLKLWDEDRGRLVGFREAGRTPPAERTRA